MAHLATQLNLRRAALAPAIAAGLLAGGCAHVPAWEQRLVAKPGMIFSSSAVLASPPALVSQIEPGRAAAGGAAAVGCSSCR